MNLLKCGSRDQIVELMHHDFPSFGRLVGTWTEHRMKVRKKALGIANIYLYVCALI